MKIIRVFAAISVFLIFFVWAFFGKAGEIFSFYWWILPLSALFFVLFYVSRKNGKFSVLADFAVKNSFCIFPLFAFFASLFVAVFLFSGLPHVPDEVNYKYIAEALLDERITTDLHPHYEFFHIVYTDPAIGGTYSIYQIGYSLFLAPFVFLKIPFLCNPLLNAISVLLIGKIANGSYGKKNAAIAMALASTSLFAAMMGGTWMAHSFCAVCQLAAFYFMQRSIDGQGMKRIVCVLFSAFFISFLIFARPQNAFFALLFVLMYLFVFTDKKSFFVSCTAMGVLISLFFLLFLYSNSTISGSMTELKHERFWKISEPEDDCIGLGLGKGCRFGTPEELPPEGLTVPVAARITAWRLNGLVELLTYNPFMFLFLLLPFVFCTEAAALKKNLVLLGGFLIFFIVYFFYYYYDTAYGPRYYYEAAFFLFPLMAEGIIAANEKLKMAAEKAHEWCGTLMPSFLSASFVFSLLFVTPGFFSYHLNSFWGADPLLAKALEEKNIDEGVVFIAPDYFYANGAARMNMHKIDENRLIFALDLGYESNQKLMDYYKGKKFYHASFNRYFSDHVMPDIVKIERDPDVKSVTLEMEHKSYPLDGVPDYCNKMPQYPDFVNKYAGFSLPAEMTEGKVFFFCDFIAPDQFYTFGQYLEEGGKYKVRIFFAAVPESGIFTFDHKNFTERLDLQSNVPELKVSEFVGDFNKGMNFIKISPDLGQSKKSYFVIDRIELVPVSETVKTTVNGNDENA